MLLYCKGGRLNCDAAKILRGYQYGSSTAAWLLHSSWALALVYCPCVCVPLPLPHRRPSFLVLTFVFPLPPPRTQTRTMAADGGGSIDLAVPIAREGNVRRTPSMAGGGNAVGYALQVDRRDPRLFQFRPDIRPVLDTRGALGPLREQRLGCLITSCLDTHLKPSAAGSTLLSPRSCYP